MRKPSDEFHVEETNDLLAQIPGLGFAVSGGKQRMTGGNGGALDVNLKVGATNKIVEAITGGGLSALSESGPASTSHQKIYDRIDEAVQIKDVKDMAQHLKMLADEIVKEAKEIDFKANQIRNKGDGNNFDEVLSEINAVDKSLFRIENNAKTMRAIVDMDHR